MKKLMFAAAVAAMTAGAFADSCSEEAAYCRAWDVKMSLKSLCPQKTNCKADACSDSTVYYLDNCTRKVKGYLWVCEYECGKEFNVCLWDPKNNRVIIPVAYGEFVNAEDDIFVYGKKANKVAGTITFDHDNLALTAAGIGGKMVRGNATDDCYIKSLSGYAAGKIALAWGKAKKAKGSLCEEEIDPEEPCEEVKVFPLCEACCDGNYCSEDAGTLDDGLAPAVGTWSMKYNKKVSKGNKSISALVPAYAL